MAFVRAVGKFKVLLFLYFPVYAFSQACENSVSGKVLDIETKQPVGYASVLEINSGKGDITDEDGNFTIIGLCNTEYDLRISFVGYKTSQHHHDSYHETPTILLAPDDQLLESIVVEGAAEHAGIESMKLDYLDLGDLTNDQGSGFAERLSKISGVSMVSTGQNIQKPMIHGLHGNRILIINNGVRHEFQNWGEEHAPEIDPNQAQNIELIKGASAVKYGPDAIGGVVLINPPALDLNSGLTGELKSVLASNGRSGDAAVRLHYGWNRWVFGLQGNVIQQGDLHAPDYQLTNTGKSEKSGSFAVRYHRGRFNAEGYWSHFGQNLGILRGSVNESLSDLQYAMSQSYPAYTSHFSYQINNPRQQVTHNLLRLKGSYVWDRSALNFQYAFQQNERKEFDVRKGGNNDKPSINLELKTHIVDAEWIHPKVLDLDGVMGIQSLYQDNNNLPGTNTLPFVPNYNNTRFGYFLIEKKRLGEHLFEFGVRLDRQNTSVRGYDANYQIFRNDFNYTQLTSTIGYQRIFANQTKFLSNLGLSWRPPSVSELYSFGKHGFSVEYGMWRYDVNNAQIDIQIQDNETKPVRPEVGLKWINTISQDRSNVSWDVTLHANHIENYIYSRPFGVTNTVRGAFPFYVYQQTTALLAGCDFDLDFKLKNRVSGDVSASYLWSKDIGNSDYFTEMPPMNLAGRLAYEIKKIKSFTYAELGVQGNYTFRYWQAPKVVAIDELIHNTADVSNGNFDFMNATDGYFLTEIYWMASFKKLSWSLRCNNLLDVKYRIYTDRLRYFSDDMGRNIKLTLKYKI